MIEGGFGNNMVFCVENSFIWVMGGNLIKVEFDGVGCFVVE